jgi:aminoglycoside N3'-acetyltransferase
MLRSSYTHSDIVEVYSQLSICEGDNVFVTTGLGFLGYPSNCSSIEDICSLHLEVLREIVGKSGTIFVPTYSYTFGRSKPGSLATFDVQSTASSIGPFPNHILTVPGVRRSLDPMVSVAGLGPSASLLEEPSNSSYGSDSVFARFLECNLKCLSVGLGPNWTPFIHYLDFIDKSVFRYDKILYGYLRNYEGELCKTHWIYNAPVRSSITNGDCHKLGRLAEKHGIWSSKSLGKSSVYSCNYMEYFEFARALKNHNPWITAAGPARPDIRAIELETLPESGQNNKTIRKPSYGIIQDIHFHNVSKYLTPLLNLKVKASIDYSSVEVGSMMSGYYVPETWIPLFLRLSSNSGQTHFLSNSYSELLQLVQPYSTSVNSVFSQITQTLPMIKDRVSTYYPYFSLTPLFYDRFRDGCSDELILHYECIRPSLALEFIVISTTMSSSRPIQASYICIDTRDFGPDSVIRTILDIGIQSNTVFVVGAQPFALLAYIHQQGLNPLDIDILVVGRHRTPQRADFLSGNVNEACSSHNLVVNNLGYFQL